MQQLIGKVRAALDDYRMIAPNDKIAVGISGGKDSLVLLASLAKIQKFYPIPFTLVAITVDPCFDQVHMNTSGIARLCAELNVEYRCKRSELGEIIFNRRKEKNPCSLCARMRRGMLHDMAKELSCTKVALGHHFDDAVETFFMNLFQCGKIGCFSPVSYLSRKDLYLIRPMINCEESEISRAASRNALPIEKNKCPIDGHTERQRTKELIASLEKEYPDLRKKVIGAMVRSDTDDWGTCGGKVAHQAKRK